MIIHLEPRQGFHRRRFAPTLRLTGTTALLSRYADSGEPLFENRVFLQSR
jgi:hypothetical protein